MTTRTRTLRKVASGSHRIAVFPAARLGWWAVGLAVASLVLVLAWSLTPAGAFPGFVCGLAGGILALLAIFRRGERAISVFAAAVPLVMVVVFVLAELIIGHD